MALTKFEKDMVIIQKLDDEPNDVGGLTSAELKAKFDEGGEAIKKYINDTLTPELDSGFSDKVPTSTTINGKALNGNVTITKADVGLGQADNTPDLQKPLSVQQKAYIDKVAADFIAGQFPVPLQIGQGGTGAKTSQEALFNLGAAVRPNLLINGGLRVWQQYPDGYTGAPNNIYIPDRFKIQSVSGSQQNTITKANDYGGIYNQSGPNFAIRYYMENAEEMDGKTLTLSVLRQSSGGSLEIKSKTMTVSGWDTSTDILSKFGNDFAFVLSGEKDFCYKLEEGEGQTLGYKDSAGTWHQLPQPDDDYQTQLAKCRAYLKPLNGMYVGGTSSISDTAIGAYVPGIMRANPVVSGVTKLGDAYIAGAEVPGGILYFGDGAFSVIQKGAGYVIQIDQSTSIGTLKTGKVVFDAGWLNAEL